VLENKLSELMANEKNLNYSNNITLYPTEGSVSCKTGQIFQIQHIFKGNILKPVPLEALVVIKITLLIDYMPFSRCLTFLNSHIPNNPTEV
jgi:hypothetical protein